MVISGSSIALFCAEWHRVDEAQRLLEQQARLMQFSEIVLASSRPPARSSAGITLHLSSSAGTWADYQRFMLRLNDYVTSPHVLVIQLDGHILHPELWSDEFLNYDYVGAPWPDDPSWIEAQFPLTRSIFLANEKRCRVGNGGFSLRSRRFLEYAASFEDTGGYGEDAFLCIHNYRVALERGVRFPSVQTAMRFSIENPIRELNCRWPEMSGEFKAHRSFGWHTHAGWRPPAGT